MTLSIYLVPTTYYGQNSYGATHPNTLAYQKSLSAYCQDDTINIIPLAFLHVFFSDGGLPEINLANACNSDNGNVFPGTNLAKCPQLTDDIKGCQARGKIVTLSLGGATGQTRFSSDGQARAFAQTVWNLFLGGSSDTRPFGDAVLDGIDLDIESGNGTGMTAFVRKLRSLAKNASKTYYITAAPQCPFPDAYVGSAISAVGFDAIFVQYNNYCGLNHYNDPSDWDFGVWDDAKNSSPNKNVKIYIGAPAAQSAAGTGYVSAATLGNIAKQTRSKYSSFGGIMLWDMSQAYGKYDIAVKNALLHGGSAVTTSTTTTETPTTYTTPTTTTTPISSPESCTGIANWDQSIPRGILLYSSELQAHHARILFIRIRHLVVTNGRQIGGLEEGTPMLGPTMEPAHPLDLQMHLVQMMPNALTSLLGLLEPHTPVKRGLPMDTPGGSTGVWADNGVCPTTGKTRKRRSRFFKD
ncbi:hypothetical protein H0H93_016551 [Arthromyces matolae]|nr:hypothetical protein H0H93_016551 [Arthromyces matolae]